MNAVETHIRNLVEIELAAANERFPQFHSQHEGWAVIKEEVDETEAELDKMEFALECAWGVITSNITDDTAIVKLKEFSINAACEAIQVAAMCQKFLEMEAVNGG